MISNDIYFPCLEVPKCYITCKEFGVQLSCSANNNNNGQEVSWTKRRSIAEQWYITTHQQEASIVTFQSVKHNNAVLYSTLQGKIGATTKSLPNDYDIYWQIEEQSKSGITLKSVQTKQYLSIVNDTCCLTPSLPPSSSSSLNDGKVSNNHERNNNKLLKQQQQKTKSNENDKNFIASIIWDLEYISGELCFISNPISNIRLCCNFMGQISLSRNWKGWEIWRFIRRPDNNTFVISSWTHSNYYLCSDSDGQVSTTSTHPPPHHAVWKIEKLPQGGLSIQSVAHDRYLIVQRQPQQQQQRHRNLIPTQMQLRTTISKSTTTTTSNNSSSCTWYIEAAHNHTYSIITTSSLSTTTTSTNFSDNKNHNNNYNNIRHYYRLGCTKQGPFLQKATTTKRPFLDSSTLWKLEASEGTITIFSPLHKSYLGSTQSGKVVTTNQLGPWSLWDMQDHDDKYKNKRSDSEQKNQNDTNDDDDDDDDDAKGVVWVSHASHRALSINEEQEDTTSSNNTGSLYNTTSSLFTKNNNIQSNDISLSNDTPLLITSSTNSNNWFLEPKLPASLNGTQIATIGAAGIAMTVALPLAGTIELAELGILGTEAILAASGASGATVIGMGLAARFMSLSSSSKMALSSPKTALAFYEQEEQYRPLSSWRTW